jgi:signal transduction histidine kinase
VAHELNNALASIMAVSSLLQRRGDDVAAMAELILQASCRGRDVVKALLDFSRKDLQGATLVDLNDLVARQAALLTSTTRHAIRIVQDLQPGLPWILAGESALGSVVMKLALNAVEAMPSGGTLTLKTRALPEDGVTLSVEDTGQGMSEAVRVRAMEPFFTTKPFGQGTGLGLSTVHGIVRAHGGTLEIGSAPGLGTQVLLSLPAAPDQSAPA